MAIKKIETRIQNKIDFLANWENADLELLPGEIAFVKVIDQEANITDENQTEPDIGESTQTYSILLKVGEADENGNPKAFDALPWLSAPASDVYEWAKQAEKPSYTFEEVGAEGAGTANNEIRIHNVDTLAHSDIRELVADLETKFTDYYTSSEVNGKLAKKADLENGKVAQGQLPNNVINPTNISAFNNDAEYQTVGQVTKALANFYAKADTYSKSEINTKLNDYYTSNEVNAELAKKADLTDGKVPKTQLPDDIVNHQQTQANWNQTDSTKVDFIKNKPTKVSDFDNDAEYQSADDVANALDNYYKKVDTYSKSVIDDKLSRKADLENGKVPKTQLPDDIVNHQQTQANWNQTDSTKVDFIKNKPTDVSAFNNDANYQTESQVATTLNNYYTKSEAYTQNEIDTKLDNYLTKAETYTREETNTKLSSKADLEAGQVPWSQLPDNIENVQADFEQTHIYDPAYIKNKPCCIRDKGFKITWDGDVVGKTSIMFDYPNVSMLYCKIMDDPRTSGFGHEIAPARWRVSLNNNNQTVETFNYVFGTDDINGNSYYYLIGQKLYTSPVIIYATGPVSIPWNDKPTYLEVPEAGIYFGEAISLDGAFVTELIQDEIIVPLDDKFIPNTIVREDTFNTAISSCIKNSFINVNTQSNVAVAQNVDGTFVKKGAKQNRGYIKIGNTLIQWGCIILTSIPAGLTIYKVELPQSYSDVNTYSISLGIGNGISSPVIDGTYWTRTAKSFNFWHRFDATSAYTAETAITWMTIGY